MHIQVMHLSASLHIRLLHIHSIWLVGPFPLTSLLFVYLMILYIAGKFGEFTVMRVWQGKVWQMDRTISMA